MLVSSAKVVSTTTWVSGCSARIRAVAVIPSMTGMERSIRTTSGCSSPGQGDGLGAVGGGTDDLDAGGQAQQRDQAFPDGGLVVRDDYPQQCRRIRRGVACWGGHGGKGRRSLAVQAVQ